MPSRQRPAILSGMEATTTPCAFATRLGITPAARGSLARDLPDWHKPFTGVFDSNVRRSSNGADGELNVSYNCIDRHLAQAPTSH